MPAKKRKDKMLGRELINDHRRRTRSRLPTNNSILHTADLKDDCDRAKLNLRSITEQSSFQEFFTTAQLAEREFKAEVLNIEIVDPTKVGMPLSQEDYSRFEKFKTEYKDRITIPRRPSWDKNTTSEELQIAERDQFNAWRKNLSFIQENENVIFTPFEKNLEFWRQLWRVIERSDVVVQILDARNPLLFRCEDLEKYVKEVNNDKINMLLLNKADLLTESQRKIWAEYFDKVGIKVVFFSAKEAALETVLEEEEENIVVEKESSDGKEMDSNAPQHVEEISEKLAETDLNSDNRNSYELLRRDELISFFDSFSQIIQHPVSKDGCLTIGLVGYPNVGKSSTINALFTSKKVSVSATPGKTKHFQTLYLTENIILCDCPGLVMPSLVSTKAEMVLNGILPIDQLIDHVSPTNLLASLIPRKVIEAEYGIMIPAPEEDQKIYATSMDILNSYAYYRGFMTQKNQLNNPRAARFILKDFVSGRLLYCVAPPAVPQEEFHQFVIKQRKIPEMIPKAERALGVSKITSEKFNEQFFDKESNKSHKKGIQKIGPNDANKNQPSGEYKPWKDHKEKRNRKEKLRRIYGHLDAV